MSKWCVSKKKYLTNQLHTCISGLWSMKSFKNCQKFLYQWYRNWGAGRGGHCPPPIFGRSVNPIPLFWGKADYPHLLLLAPPIFSPSGITVMSFQLCMYIVCMYIHTSNFFGTSYLEPALVHYAMQASAAFYKSRINLSFHVCIWIIHR